MANMSVISLNFAVRYKDVVASFSVPSNISYSLNLEASVACSSLSLITFLLLLLLLIYFHNKGDDKVGNCGAPSNLLLFLGVVMTTVTSLVVPNYDANIYKWYLIFLLLVVGIVGVVLGSHFFFSKSTSKRDLSYNHENLHALVWIITIPLVLMELLELIGTIYFQTEDYKIKTAVGVVGIAQKLTQAGIYHYSLWQKRAEVDMKEAASWYLKIVSLFNFTMWLDSMVTNSDGNIKKFFGQSFSIIDTANTALLIDYRLLCCLLFAEHALEVKEEEEEGEESPDETDNSDKEVVGNKFCQRELRPLHMRVLGFMFGLLILSLQIVVGLQSYGVVGAWSNLFSILADVFVVVLGLLFVSLENEPVQRDAKGVDLMVAMMGIIGFLYWIVMATLDGAWVRKVPLDERSFNYLKWSCAKNVFRPVGIVFQLYIFIKCDSRYGCRPNVRNKTSRCFLLPSLMLSLLSVFVMAIMDGHSEIVEELIEGSQISPVLIGMLKIAEPLYLGYCLHLFLHFFIVYTNVRSDNGGDGESIPLQGVAAKT